MLLILPINQSDNYSRAVCKIPYSWSFSRNLNSMNLIECFKLIFLEMIQGAMQPCICRVNCIHSYVGKLSYVVLCDIDLSSYVCS